MAQSPRPFDIVLYGATGFTGQCAARYLQAHAPPSLCWAVAGRRASKLAGHGRDVIIADSTDPASVDQMVRQARVVVSTAGPFSMYGTSVVEACVRHGTHYCDITGETPWVAQMIARFHADAERAGTRIVPFCGVDSVPSDLGAWWVQQWVREHWGCDLKWLRGAFRIRGGGLNGGTLASALNLQAADLRDPALLGGHAMDWRGVRFDRDLDCWLTEWLMAPVNTRVVARSQALLGGQWRYEECMETTSWAAGWAICQLLGGGERALQTRIGRRLARRWGPRPGEGPSEAKQERGNLRVRFIGESEDGRKVAATVEGAGDAGNRNTVRMLCESGLAQLDDGLPGRAGVITPAVAFGDVLVQRLRAAGMRWDVGPLA